MSYKPLGELFGEKSEFWLELKRQADKLDVLHLVREIAHLRAKVSFYESRIAEMENFKNITNEQPTN